MNSVAMRDGALCRNRGETEADLDLDLQGRDA